MDLWTKSPRKPKPRVEKLLGGATKLHAVLFNAHASPQTDTYTHRVPFS